MVKIVNLQGIQNELLYAETQCNPNIEDGDVLFCDNGFAIMVQTWPVNESNKVHSFHVLSSGSNWQTFADGKYLKSYNLLMRFKILQRARFYYLLGRCDYICNAIRSAAMDEVSNYLEFSKWCEKEIRRMIEGNYSLDAYYGGINRFDVSKEDWAFYKFSMDLQRMELLNQLERLLLRSYQHEQN